jgi:GDP-L-fucose synthase
MFKDSKIYVAGHTGLLGSALIKKLKAQGHCNIVVKGRGEIDLTDQPSVDKFFSRENPEYVFMAAGLTGGIMANKTYPATFLYTNLAMQNNMFEAANKYKVKNLVFYASSCVYPKNAEQPMKEEYMLTGSIEETSEAYAAAKIAGIIACRSYNRQYKTNRFIALLPNSIYGPNDSFDPESSHVLSALIRRLYEAKSEKKDSITLWGSGDPLREFIFSEDVAEASIFVVKNADKLLNTHYNVGTGMERSIKELAGIIAEVVGFNGDIKWDRSKPDGVPRKLLDSSRVRNMGWMPATSLKEGIKTTYDWFVKNSK